MRGGKREGSGRKKGEGSKVVRVPLGCLDAVESVIARHKGDDEKSNIAAKKHFGKLKQDKINEKRKKTLDAKALKPFLDEFEKLPRKERRLLLKKYKTAEGVANHMMESVVYETHESLVNR